MKKLIAVLLSIMMFAMTSVGALPEKDIVDTAIDAEIFKTLVAAVIEAELVDTLRGDGPFTVFAPTDEAFEVLLAQLNLTVEEFLLDSRLKQILLYHVVADQIKADDVSKV